MLPKSLSSRLIFLFAAPAFLLGGCTTLQSLGDHAAATVGLGDDTPRQNDQERRKQESCHHPLPSDCNDYTVTEAVFRCRRR